MKILLAFIVLQTSLSVYAEDMQQYLKDTQTMVRQGMHKEALERYIWFHDHALEHDAAMYGVRLSFALEYWKSLGNVYPPAKKALEETRNRKTDRILKGEGDFQLFHDVAALNRTLDERGKTVTLFEHLDRANPALAKRCWDVAKEYVISSHRYSLARKYLGDYLQSFTRVKAMHDSSIEMYDDPKIGGEGFKKYNENQFVWETLQIIKVAVVLGDEEEAAEIQAKALAVVNDARLLNTISKDKSNTLSFLELAGGMRNASNPATSLVGKDAIDFSLKDLNGETVSLSDFKGKAVVLDFWATWCGPCREAIPHLEALHRKYKNKGLVIIGINKETDHALVKKYATENITYMVLLDADLQSEQYGVQGIPSKFYIDAKAKIRHYDLGYKPGAEVDIERTIQELLAEIEGDSGSDTRE